MPLEDEAPIAPAKCAPLDELKKIAPTIETIASTTPVPRRPAPTRKTPKNEGDFDPSHDVDWQKLWLATQRASWRSLVVVPCGREVDALAVASALADVGSVHLSRDVSVIDATRVALGELRPRLADVAARIEAGETVLIAVRPVGDDPTARAFAENADAALLCVTLGTSSLTEAARAVEEIGRERFLGTAVLAPKGAG